MRTRQEIVESIRLEGDPKDALILSPKEFGIKYGLSGGTIIRVMKDLGYSTKERIVLEISKPVEWDEFTAYLLGYFLGDGCMHEPRTKDYGQLDITSKDLEHIEAIRERLNPNLKIGYWTSSKGEWYRMFWTSKEWYRFMRSHGICQNKSEFGCNVVYPDGEYFGHFVRGLFDSDGCVSNTNYGIGLQVSIFGHESYLQELSDRLPVTGKIYSDLRSKSRFIGCYSYEDVKAMYRLMYSNATIFLNRKRIRFQEKGL